MEFQKKDKITLADGRVITVDELLGEGGQGRVYLVSENGAKYALKAYKGVESADFRFNLKNNIAKGAPSASFLWPKQLIDFEDGTIGYLMDLRPKNFQPFVSYLRGSCPFASRKVLLTWCIRLCEAFKSLHEKGYSYQDLNDGNFFLDPTTGDLLICDNDNVTADKKNLGVLGKMRYVAPEIVLGKSLPDVHSDRFSLAIILFMALCLGDPFEGECLRKYAFVDEKAEREIYGSHPVFVYHEKDTSNRPIRGYHSSLIRRWAGIPSYVKSAFHHTFVDGIADRENGRTTELEWLRVLVKYRDELVICPSCGKEYYYGYEKGLFDKCPLCNAAAKRVATLSVGKYRIALDLGKEIYAVHVDKYSTKYNAVVGEVIASKNDPSRFGLRLRLPHGVEIEDQTGKRKSIEAGGVVPLVKNLKIYFDQETIGEIA